MTLGHTKATVAHVMSLAELLNCYSRIRLTTTPDEHRAHSSLWIGLSHPDGGNFEIPWAEWLALVKIRSRESRP